MPGTAHTPCPVAVVTDSTAYLPADLARAAPVTVIPLTVVIDGAEGLEGIDVSPRDVARSLEARRAVVTTSRPSPGQFTEVYEQLLGAGAPGVVSIHLSARLSGTYDSAVLAAAEFGGRVEVLDSRSTGMGLGFPALAAAAAAGSGELATVRDAARAAITRTTTLFYVDTLEYLRRGGRIGAASALLGTALSVKPILHMVAGEIVVRDKVRTASRALTRMVDLAAEAAGEAVVDIAVHHLAAPDRAAELADRLARRLGGRLRDCHRTEVGAAVGAHVGPGMTSLVVSRRP
jgi:fatty acid kinase fatty acid binding subunit